MRKWFAYIEKSYDKDFKEGNVIIFNKQSIYAEKGVRRVMSLFNIKTHKSKDVAVVVGLGYADFRDEADFKKRLSEIIAKKLKEIEESV